MKRLIRNKGTGLYRANNGAWVTRDEAYNYYDAFAPDLGKSWHHSRCRDFRRAGMPVVCVVVKAKPNSSPGHRCFDDFYGKSPGKSWSIASNAERGRWESAANAARKWKP